MKLEQAMAGALAAGVVIVLALRVAQSSNGPSALAQASTVQPHPWCTESDTTEVYEIVLTPDSLGPITPDMTRKDLEHRCPQLTSGEGLGYTGVPRATTALRLLGRQVGVIEWESDGTRLSRVVILHESVRVLSQLGVGSSPAEIRSLLTNVRASADEGGVFVWSDDLPHISFLLAVSLPDSVMVPARTLDLALIPAEARVREVLFGPW